MCHSRHGVSNERGVARSSRVRRSRIYQLILRLNYDLARCFHCGVEGRTLKVSFIRLLLTTTGRLVRRVICFFFVELWCYRNVYVKVNIPFNIGIGRPSLCFNGLMVNFYRLVHQLAEAGYRRPHRGRS